MTTYRLWPSNTVTGATVPAVSGCSGPRADKLHRVAGQDRRRAASCPGTFSLVLLGTDFAGGVPSYRVTFNLDGSRPVTKVYTLPRGSTSVDLSGLIIV